MYQIVIALKKNENHMEKKPQCLSLLLKKSGHNVKSSPGNIKIANLVSEK